MKEKWLDIVGYNGKYKVSNTGKIKSLNYNNTGKEKILKPKVNKGGYLEIKLSIHDKKKDFQLARLVLETFTDIPLTKNIIILYKDGNKENCSLENLYCTTRGAYQEFTYDRGNRPVKYVEYYGKKTTVKELSKITNNSTKTIRRRLRNGWNAYECEIPKGEGNGKLKNDI